MSHRNRVLIVESSDDIRALYAEALEGEEYRLLLARSGVEGLALSQSAGARMIVLLDTELIDMSGAEFIESMRLDPRRVETKVIFMSAWGNRHMMAEEAGAWGLLQKPFQLNDLISILRKASENQLPPTLRNLHPFRSEKAGVYSTQFHGAN